MSKFRFLTLAVIVLLLLNLGTLLFLLLPKKDEGMSRAPGNAASDYIIEQLQLDTRQQEQFIELRNQHRAIVRQAREEDRRLHDIYFSLLKTDNPEEGKVDSVSSLIAEQRSQIEAATFEHFRQLRKLCRPEQKLRFDATIDEIARRVAPGKIQK